MSIKILPFSKSQIEKIIQKYPTPFHIYDEQAIQNNARQLLKTFAWAPGFKEYFAVKATPNPFIIKLLHEEGFGVDCSSLSELILAEKVGMSGNNIMFSSNDTPAEEFQKARQLGAIINLDDISHISFLEEQAGLPELISFRYNPGPLRKGNAIIGVPEEAKYGFTKKQLFEGYRILKEKGIKRFGLHTMVASNELHPHYFIETAKMLFELVAEISQQLGIHFELINLGGGIGIPYKLDQKPIDLSLISHGIHKEYKRIIKSNGLDPLQITMECGRYITGPYGYLVTTVLHKKEIYKSYVGLDACMANLMRPALYGAYHHITVLGKEDWPLDHMYDVTGSLCENNDKFAINRQLPQIERGDLIVIHDAGAHGHAMGFNYNGKLRSAELLLKPDGDVELIRRAETMDDYFATLDFFGCVKDGVSKVAAR
jgi:Diaminopimelate decarboxylase